MTKHELAMLIVAAFDADESGFSVEKLKSYEIDTDLNQVKGVARNGNKFRIIIQETF